MKIISSGEKNQSEAKSERALRWLRNINAIGAVAIGGAGLAVNSELLMAWGALNLVQAIFFEGARQILKRRNNPKLRPASL